MKITSLEELSFDQIYKAFAEAFKDYEMQLDENGLKKMLGRRGFVPELSFGAFTDDRMISFTFNGIGKFNGKHTAYDTGTGTIEEFRGQGLATKIFKHSIPLLKEAGIKQYLLEVLQHNDAAVSVYKKLGFKVSREFNYFVEEISNIKVPAKLQGLDLQLKSIDLSYKNDLLACCDFSPSWQNSFAAIERTPDSFKILGTFDDNTIIGYVIFEPSSGDISQLAVHPSHRRKGIGSKFLSEAIQLIEISSIKLINSDLSCKSITAFLKSFSIQPTGKQYEMIKGL